MSQNAVNLLNWLVLKTKEYLSDCKIKDLINQAFSDKQSDRVLARAKLKKQFPDVYEQVEAEEAKA